VPFSALFDAGRETYLVEHHDIAYSPSAGVFMATPEKHRDRNKVARSILVFANPSIPRDRYPALPSLDAAEREGKAVARPYSTARVWERDEATAQRFLLEAPAFHVVHFGGHGVNSRREPASSELICADDGSGVRVTARQIARMKFESTEVVVLAACSTMTGRNAAMEGVASLGRAFLVAGVPEVIGTLWDIQDRDAAPLMSSLHEQLARGVPAAEALSNTQRAALRSGTPDRQNPGHWAAFTIMSSASN
jgi:CHAT domain-containing protein